MWGFYGGSFPLRAVVFLRLSNDATPKFNLCLSRCWLFGFFVSSEGFLLEIEDLRLIY